MSPARLSLSTVASPHCRLLFHLAEESLAEKQRRLSGAAQNQASAIAHRGLEVKAIVPLPVEGEVFFLTFPFIDQAFSQACAASSPFQGDFERYRDLSSTDGKWPIILANTCSRLKNSISRRRLFVSKSLHGIDLCRVAGGNVAGHGCDRHQERRDHNQSQQIVSLNTVEKLREQWHGGKRARNADHHSDERKHHSLSQH